MAEDGTIQSLLLRYSLGNVEPVKNQEGELVVINQGSYGRILKVHVSGALCAAKEIHFSIAMGPGNVYVQQFTREIDLMSQMRHPNVVQFLGVHLPERPNVMSPVRDLNLPWLVMEYVPFELHSMIEEASQREVEIPSSVKVSLMLDIARGLSYIHQNHSSEIIHRDLSARNVLLTASLSAKLADFGVSKRRVNATMTMGVGNPLYMPPENKPGSTVRYNSQMDIFSFGVIILFIISENFPKDLLSETFTNTDGNLMARAEVERRQQYIDAAERSPNPYTPTLVTLCKECLDNQPHKRPKAERILEQLNRLNIAENILVTKKLQFLTSMWQPQRQQERNNSQEVVSLNTQLRVLREQLERRDGDVGRLEGELSQQRARYATELERQAAQSQVALEESQSQCQRLRNELSAKEEQLADKQRAYDREKELAENYERIINLTGASENELQATKVELVKVQQNRDEWRAAHIGVIDQLRECELALGLARQEASKLGEDLKKREEELSIAKQKAFNYKDQLQQLESRQEAPSSLPSLPPSGLQTSLRLSCTRQQTPAPQGLCLAHCVHYKNQILYGGGIHAAEANHLKSILAFDLDSNKWSVFSAYLKLIYFSLAVVKGQLLMVGGYDDTLNEYTDKISKFVEGEGWKEMAERLPTKKAKTALLAYRNWLIVAGGCTSGGASLDQVHAIQLGVGAGWRTLSSLPERCQDLQCASYVSLHRTDASKDVAVWYLTSYITGLSSRQPVMGVSVPDLVMKGGKWVRLPDPPILSPAVTTLHGHLLALGGQDPRKRMVYSNKVYMYHHGTKEWLCVAEVSNNYSPRMSTTCVSMSSDPGSTRFMILGGQDKANKYSTTVEVFNQLSLK